MRLLSALLVCASVAHAFQSGVHFVLTNCSGVNDTSVPENTRFTYVPATYALKIFDQCVDTHGNGVYSIPYTWECIENQNQVFQVNNVTKRITLLPAQQNRCLGGLLGAPMLLACDGSSKGDLDMELLANGQIRVIAEDLCLQIPSGSTTTKSCLDADLKDFPYCNPKLDAKTRAKDLVSRMTAFEKLSNSVNNNNGVPRLGVPPMNYGEALHGIVNGCGKAVNGSTGCPTSFPHALLLGASFNASLFHQIGHAIGVEGRALEAQGLAGMAYWAPDINLFRDPRWGRGQEVPGEDPFLNGEYAMGYMRGIQFGDDDRYLMGVSTGKHFLNYDVEGNGGVDRGAFDAIVTKKDQVEYYLPQWRAAIQGANLQSIMCSYNAINGVPACGNDLFMNKVAREAWGFDGYIVSDCGAINDPAFYQYVKDYLNGSYDESIKFGMTSGCDVNCGDDYLSRGLVSYVDGVLPEEVLDQAVGRMFTAMIRLGYLDDPANVSYRHYGPELVDSQEHRTLALEAAKEGIVLLKNENGLLPLNKKQKVAVIGPHGKATDDLISIYKGTNTLVQEHSPLLALVNAGVNVIGYEQGCDLVTKDLVSFPDAQSLASKADVALVFVGLHPGQGFEDAREDEGYDRHKITFPGSQLQLIQAVFAANPNTVVVLINGGTISSSWMKDNIPAIVEAWYPGELGGDAITSILIGETSPSGRLPVTIYPEEFIAERPLTDMSMTGGNGITYRYYTKQPLWPFGFGLSYTNFSYKLLGGSYVATTQAMFKSFADYYTAGGSVFGKFKSPLNFQVQVTNIGKVCASTSVLGFLKSDDKDAPLNELFGFAKVHNLCPGESKVVILNVPAQALSLVDEHGVESIRPGVFHAEIADGAIRSNLMVFGPAMTVFSL